MHVEETRQYKRKLERSRDIHSQTELFKQMCKHGSLRRIIRDHSMGLYGFRELVNSIQRQSAKCRRWKTRTERWYLYQLDLFDS